MEIDLGELDDEEENVGNKSTEVFAVADEGPRTGSKEVENGADFEVAREEVAL